MPLMKLPRWQWKDWLQDYDDKRGSKIMMTRFAHLLSWELGESSGLNGGVGLDHLGCAEGLFVKMVTLMIKMMTTSMKMTMTPMMITRSRSRRRRRLPSSCRTGPGSSPHWLRPGWFASMCCQKWNTNKQKHKQTSETAPCLFPNK